MEYSLPEILNKAGIKGYSPRLGNAINTLLRTQDREEYNESLRAATKELTGYENIELYEEDNQYSPTTHFDGLPIYQPLLLQQVEATADDLLLDSAVVELNRPKRIVVTELKGKDNSVKEFINNGDWQIKVSGILANRGVGYPKDQLRALEDYMSAKVAIPVVHEVLNRLNIYEMVVTDYAYPRSPFQNIQPYEFSCLSDEPTIINL